MNKNSRTEKNGSVPRSFDEYQKYLIRSRKTRISAIPLLIVLCLMGTAASVVLYYPKLQLFSQSAPQTDPFEQGSHQAMQAAQLTQSAVSNEEWTTVATLWEAAVDAMKQVPSDHRQYAVAREKVREYRRNLDYARTNMLKRSPNPNPTQQSWTLGSGRTHILEVQGAPNRVVPYELSCTEVFHYGNSTVELKHGLAIQYNNADNNLRVSVSGPLVASTEGTQPYWSLGSRRDAVSAIQGTPQRVIRYDSSEQEVFDYGRSTVELTNGIVTGYHNLDDDLRVSVQPLMAASQEAGSALRLGITREALFRIQGTPTAVTQENGGCREVMDYGSSQVELKNGVVAGYDNKGQNLSVQ